MYCELKSGQNQILTKGSNIAKGLLDALFPTDKRADTQYHRLMRSEIESEYIADNDQPFTELEVMDVVNIQNPKKTPGADGFTAAIIQKCHQIMPQYLTNLYNKCLYINYFPKIWKKSIVKVLPKPEKPDYSDPNAYRPISLLSVFAKILEKLIINRIIYYLKNKNSLSPNQFGFTAQTSTEDALHSLIKFIKNAFQKKGYALAISLDITGTFNYAWWPKILCQLRTKNCPKNLFLITKSYFSEREAEIWHLNNIYRRDINVGCPQSSACGPHYWNIRFDDIHGLSNSKNVIIDAFADDTLIKIYGNSTVEIELLANSILQKVESYAKHNKLIFNAQKTQCVLFTKNLKYQKPVIMFNGQQLPLKNSFKHLGIIVDSKLTFKEHANYLLAKVSELINNLLRFAKIEYGLNAEAMDIIYKGAVLPIISYGVSVWAQAIDRQFMTKPLTSLQRRYALRMTRAYRTVSAEAANILANFLPIDLYLKERAIMYFIKKAFITV
jgi:hypothetical protein